MREYAATDGLSHGVPAGACSTTRVAEPCGICDRCRSPRFLVPLDADLVDEARGPAAVGLAFDRAPQAVAAGPRRAEGAHPRRPAGPAGPGAEPDRRRLLGPAHRRGPGRRPARTGPSWSQRLAELAVVVGPRSGADLGDLGARPSEATAVARAGRGGGRPARACPRSVWSTDRGRVDRRSECFNSAQQVANVWSCLHRRSGDGSRGSPSRRSGAARRRPRRLGVDDDHRRTRSRRGGRAHRLPPGAGHGAGRVTMARAAGAPSDRGALEAGAGRRPRGHRGRSAGGPRARRGPWARPTRRSRNERPWSRTDGSPRCRSSASATS